MIINPNRPETFKEKQEREYKKAFDEKKKKERIAFEKARRKRKKKK